MKLAGQEQVERIAEHHFTVAELSEQWNLSREAIRRMFETEPGVVVFYYPKPNKRKYRTLRILYQRSLVFMKPLSGRERSSFVGASIPS